MTYTDYLKSQYKDHIYILDDKYEVNNNLDINDCKSIVMTDYTDYSGFHYDMYAMKKEQLSENERAFDVGKKTGRQELCDDLMKLLQEEAKAENKGSDYKTTVNHLMNLMVNKLGVK